MEQGWGGVAESMAPWPALAPYARTLVADRNSSPRIFYFDSAPGDKGRPVVLLIHGLGDEADSFRHLFPFLVRDFRLLAPDLPGFGRSETPGKTSFRLCVDAVASILETEGIEGAIVLGSSLGASIAQNLALRQPTRVGALLLEDGGSPAPNRAASSLLAMALPFFGERRYQGFRENGEAAIASLAPYYADWEALPEEDRKFLALRVLGRVKSETQGRAYLSLLRSTIATMATSSASFARQLRYWRKPLTVVWGAEDRIVPQDSGRAIAGRVSGGEFRLVEGAGHLPHQERPAALAGIIRELADEMAAGSSAESIPAKGGRTRR